MEWLIYFVCDKHKHFPNTVATALETDNFDEIPLEDIINMIFSNRQKTRMLLQEPAILDWLTSHFHNLTEIYQEILAQMVQEMYFPQAAYELLHHDLASWRDDFLKEQAANEEPNRYLDYNLEQFYNLKPNHDNIDLAYGKPGRVLEVLENHEGDFMFHLQSIAKQANSGYEYIPDLGVFFDVHKIGRCEIMRKILESKTSTNKIQVTDYLVRDLKTDSNRDHENPKDCRYELLRSLPSLLVQILFFPKQCWFDNMKAPCEHCLKDTDLWEFLLPQWRCTAFCSSASNVQCPRFAHTLALAVCDFHLINPSGKYRLRPYFTSNSRNIDVEATHYNSPTTPLVRFPNTHRVINPMETSAATDIRKYATKPEGYYLPIVRYQSLYYSATTDETKYCGTFFFYEPDSDKFLYLPKDRTLFFATKVHAWYELCKVWREKFPQRNLVSGQWPTMEYLAAIFHRHRVAMDYLDAYSLANTECTVNFARLNIIRYRYFARFASIINFDTRWHNVGMPLFFPSDTAYGIKSGGVGDFDYLDQDICIMARDLHYDNLILQHEIGSNDCVTEILHTSPHANKFLFVMHDVKQDPELFQQITIADAYPKIWFPREKGLVHVDRTETAYLKPYHYNTFAKWDYKYTRPEIHPSSTCLPIPEHEITQSDTSIFDTQSFMKQRLSSGHQSYKSERRPEDAIREHFEYKFN